LSEKEVKPTLEKYIDIENIPRKYGGTLDFKFGMMPILEPAIANALEWEIPGKSTTNPVTIVKEKVEKVLPKGYISTNDNGFPIGPIKWHETNDGNLNAIAVGSEQGSRRNDVIARMKADIAFIHGISRKNTTVDWSLERLVSTSGTATQPQEGDPEYGKELLFSSGAITPASAAMSNSGNDTAAETAATSSLQPPVTNAQPAATKDTPDAELSFDESKSPTARATLPASEGQPRTGSSNTAYAAQKGTHAEGTMAEDTPHVVDFGHGDKAAVMEPATLGQARKDPQIAKDAPEGPSVIEQVQSAVAGVTATAGAAASSVSGTVGAVATNVLDAVGLGGQKKDGEAAVQKAEEEKAKEPPLDVKDEAMKGYIRTQYPSKAPDLPPSAKPTS
jgi:hypothetical protein